MDFPVTVLTDHLVLTSHSNTSFDYKLAIRKSSLLTSLTLVNGYLNGKMRLACDVFQSI